MPSAQTVMLAIHCKRTDNVELKNPILSYIRETYSDRDADDAIDDMAAIQSMRNDMVVAQNGAQPAQRDSLAKYFRALTAIETRFPIASEKGSVRVSFPWYDAFRPRHKTSQANIHLEKAAVLFNVGALLSQQALQVERGSGEGIKQACQLFQESAGAFGSVREGEAPKVDAPRPVDLSPECLAMLEKLMLAQAQECVFYKAAMDKKSPGVLARLSKQAALMYAEVGGLFSAPALASHFERSWLAHTQMKASLYDVEALQQTGRQVQLRDQDRARGGGAAGYEETLQLALTKAQKDNAAVYLERVPPFADLPPIAPALLVKPLLPGGLDASSESWFSGLVPDNSAKALSKYSDQVDALSRELLDALAGATDSARLRLREAELPDLLEALDGAASASLPESLARELEGVAAIGGVSHLKEILTEIGDLRRHVEADISACQSALDEEGAADAAARARYGDRWNVPLSATLAKHLWEKLSSYRSTLTQASDSDAKIISRLHANEAAFAALTPDQAAGQLPRLQAPLVAVGGEDPAVVVAGLRRNLEALNQLSSERAGLEEALKETKSRDNILPKLMASSPSAFDSLFEKELKKYEGLRADVARNVTTNAELLAALSRGASSFRAVFEVGAWRQACEAAAGGVRTTLKAYREALDHLSEGLRFYMSLQEAIKTHHQQCSDYAYTRALQRDDLRTELDRRSRDEAAAAPPPPPTNRLAHMQLGWGREGGAQQQQAQQAQQQAQPSYASFPQQTPHSAGAPQAPQAPQYAQYFEQQAAPAPQAGGSYSGGAQTPQYQQHQGSFSGGYSNPPPPPVQQPYHGGISAGGWAAPPAPHQPAASQQPGAPYYGGGGYGQQQQTPHQQPQQPFGYGGQPPQQQQQQHYVGAYAAPGTPQQQQQQQQQYPGYGQ